MNEKQRLLDGLRALGVCPGDAVLVHASMKALNTPLGPEQVLDGLQEALGPEGTLLLPALTYDNVTPEAPAFDPQTSEPCIGLLPRTFWRMPGVLRSVHPTHSVCARGRLAHRLTYAHLMDDRAVGPHSPFMLLPVYRGKLLFLGDVLSACTFMHGVEDIVRPPYMQERRQIFTVSGEERAYWVAEHFGWGSEFQRIEHILDKPDLRRGKVLGAEGTLIDARALLAAALAEMRSNPYAFVTDISKWI